MEKTQSQSRRLHWRNAEPRSAGGRRCELRVKFSDVVLAQKTVGFLPARQARRFRRVKEVTAPIAVERVKDAFSFDHLPAPAITVAVDSFRHQWRVIDF